VDEEEPQDTTGSDWHPSTDEDPSTSENEAPAKKRRRPIRATTPQHNTKTHAARPNEDVARPHSIDWDDAEVHIDATLLDEQQLVLIPMFDLKPQTSQIPIAWHQFDLQKLCHQFQVETGKSIDLAVYEFAQICEDDRTEFMFSKSGAYRIMLERIMQTGGLEDSILRLRIQKRIAGHQQSRDRDDHDTRHARSHSRIPSDGSSYSSEHSEGVAPGSKGIKIKEELLTPPG